MSAPQPTETDAIEALAEELFDAGSAVTCQYRTDTYAVGWEKAHVADKVGFRHMARMVQLKLVAARETERGRVLEDAARRCRARAIQKDANDPHSLGKSLGYEGAAVLILSPDTERSAGQGQVKP